MLAKTDEEYENDLLTSVVDVQIKKGLMGVNPSDLERIVIAYEPVRQSVLERLPRHKQAQVAHVAVRRNTCSCVWCDAGRSEKIQYGGSYCRPCLMWMVLLLSYCRFIHPYCRWRCEKAENESRPPRTFKLDTHSRAVSSFGEP